MPQEAAFIIAYDLFWRGSPDIATGIILELDLYLRMREVCTSTEADIVLFREEISLFVPDVVIGRIKTGRLQYEFGRPRFLGRMLLRLARSAKASRGPGANISSATEVL